MATAPREPFTRLATPQSRLRAAITDAYRRPEPDCLPPLLAQARLPKAIRDQARALAEHLVRRLRAKSHGGGVEGLIHEYSLSSQEGVALMCLAEALLRIPDDETRDALIRDKIGGGDWQVLSLNRAAMVRLAGSRASYLLDIARGTVTGVIYR